MIRSALALVLVLTVFGAGSAAAQSAHPGFGDDERAPTGAPFSLPPGLEIAGPIVGANDDGDCPEPQVDPVGSGLWVRVCLPVRNRSGGPVTVTFPPGLVIVAASETYQNGVLVEREVVTVPPIERGGPGRLRDREEDVVYIPLHLYCINAPKEPSTPDAGYALGPVTAHGGLAEVYRLMEGKDVSNDRDPVELVQEVVYHVIRHGRLSDEDRAALQAL